MLATSFTALVGCELPIQGAPVGGFAASAALPAAVARAGGHGMLAALDLPPERLGPIFDELDRDAGRAWGVNVLVPMLDRSAVELAADRAPLVDFHYGEPDPRLVETVHAGGALASWQVGTEEEARRAADAGVDVIVAQGVDAAGRTRGRAGIMALLTRVLDVVDTPVLAAGGIGNARGVAAALAAGAAGVRVGTALLASPEAGVPDPYVAALVAARTDDTVLAERIVGRGPQVPARLLRESFVDGQADAETAFFAGESAGHVERRASAGEVVRELAEGAARLLARHASVAAV